VTHPLQDAVAGLVDVVGDALATLTGSSASSHRTDALLEASRITAAVLAADGRFTDEELESYLDHIGSHLEPPLRLSSVELRGTDLLRRHRGSLATPSTLFDLVALADRRDGTLRSHDLYRASLHLAHVAGALDRVPSLDEVRAIDELRVAMLRHLDAVGVSRPGATTGAPGSPAVGASVTSGPTPPVGTVADTASPPPARDLDDLLGELDQLVGLDTVKADVHLLASLARIRRLRVERGLPVIESSNHLVFAGNPGTGKTTVARLYSQILRAVDAVSRGHLVETDRSALVAGFVGQTAPRTRAVLEQAVGGTVLVDEAYALARGGDNDFGLEAIDTIVKFMEDHRDDLAVIVAGYRDEMADFIDTNPGLESRFARTVTFPDYTDEQLVEIFRRLGRTHRYECDDGAIDKLHLVIASAPRGRGFGNARFVRNLFEAAVARQARRLSAALDGEPAARELDDETLTAFVADDIEPLPPGPGARLADGAVT
jgi:hypothetical protein